MEALTIAKAFDALFYVATGILAWLLNSYSKRIATLEQANLTLNISLADRYVKKDDMKDLEERLITTLIRIEDKIDRKQDK